jgi:hypothetical protein
MQPNEGGTDATEPRTEEQPGLRRVTLGGVALMSARGEADGWYVAERGDKWTIGLQSRGERYVVTLGPEAMTFDSMAVAVKYLRALIAPTGVEDPSAVRSDLTSAFADAIAMIEGYAARGSSGRFQ